MESAAPLALAAAERHFRLIMSISARSTLLAILRHKSVMYGDFTLASGRKSDFYCDARLTTLDPRGAIALGEVGWALLKQEAARLKVTLQAVGGLTMGADPVALALGIGAARDGADLQVFSIRKAVKAHGRGRLIEGNFKPGDTVVAVDDTITTGGSTLEAIEKIRAEGGTVAFAVVLVDRGEGGKEAIEQQAGIPVFAIFTRQEIDAATAAD